MYVTPYCDIYLYRECEEPWYVIWKVLMMHIMTSLVCVHAHISVCTWAWHVLCWKAYNVSIKASTSTPAMCKYKRTLTHCDVKDLVTNNWRCVCVCVCARVCVYIHIYIGQCKLLVTNYVYHKHVCMLWCLKISSLIPTIVIYSVIVFLIIITLITCI